MSEKQHPKSEQRADGTRREEMKRIHDTLLIAMGSDNIGRYRIVESGGEIDPERGHTSGKSRFFLSRLGDAYYGLTTLPSTTKLEVTKPGRA